MQTPVSATFTYQRDEYIRAVRYHYKTILHLRRDTIAAVASIILGLYLVAIAQISWLGWLVLCMGLVLLAMMGYALFLLPIIIYRGQPKLKDSYSLRFSEEGIDFKTQQIDSTLQWSLYHTWRLTPEFYILYYGKREFTIIPRRVFSPTDDDRLQALLHQQLGQPKP
ncbi:MAG: YcxB family protein [Cyanobacteria bacterium P01_D01_bin.156]